MYSIIVNILLILLIIGVIWVVIADDGEPGRKLGWILIIAVLPVVGIVFYLVFGLNRRTRKQYARAHKRFRERFEQEATPELRRLLFSQDRTELIDEHYRPLSRILSAAQRPMVTTADDVEIITSGQRKYELLMRDLNDAKESIHMEYFHFGADKGSREVKELLMKKAREGVKVRFINENIANLPIPQRYYKSMRRAGVEVVNFTDTRFSLLRFLTTLSYRDHRKIAVIDGRIGYTGGMNINDHYFHQWRDTHVRLTGNAVAHLQYAFLDTWLNCRGKLEVNLCSLFPMLGRGQEAQGVQEVQGTQSVVDAIETPSHSHLMQIAPGDPASPVPVVQISYEYVLTHAQRYVWFQTPYLAPPQSFLRAIKAAVASGVDVRIMLPEHCDTALMRPINKAYYRDCLDAGARLFLRGGEFIHSKVFVADDYLSCVGSTNIDYRSFDIDYEINAYMFDSALALDNRHIFEQDLALCREITLDEVLHEHWYNRVWQRLFRLMAPVV